MQKKLEKNSISKQSLCIPADEDTLFISTDDARGVRLQLDYLKAETMMKKHNVGYTVVVFGSTHIIESKSALDKIDDIKKELEADPNSKELLSALKNAQSIAKKSIYYDEARKFGQLVGKSKKGLDGYSFTLMTGGGPGIMEAANRGALDVGAQSIGLNIKLADRQPQNPYITPELCFQFHYFAIRKLHLFYRSRAFVFFPGGFGTLDELFEILTLIQTSKSKPMPIILVGQEYWEKVFDIDFLVEEGVISSDDADIIIYAKDAQDTWNSIIKWHTENKTPLF